MEAKHGLLDGVIEGRALDLSEFMSPDYGMLLDVLQQHINKNKRGKIRSCAFLFYGDSFPINTEKNNISVSGNQYNNVLKLHLMRKISRQDLEDGFRIIEGIFFVKKISGNQYVAFTLEDKDFYDYGLMKYLQSLSPDFSILALTSEELLKILYYYERNNEFTVIPTKTICYDRNERSMISHTFSSLEEIAWKLEEENLYVDKIRFKVLKSQTREKIFAGAIGRNGALEFKEGDKLHFLHLISDLFEPAAKKSAIFSASGRNDFKKIINKCIRFKYDKSVLADPTDNERFFRTLDEIPKSDFLVFHYNPYLHVSFFDYTDGSKFDIFGLSENTISVVPSQGATEASFNNMLDRIQREFGEGDIEEFEVPQFTLQDIKA